MTQEESKYISEVLQKLIDKPMQRAIKMDRKMRDYPDQYVIIDTDEVVINLTGLPAPDYTRTVAAIKYIMDWGMDKLNGFDLTFNNNFTKVRKQVYKPIKPNN